MIHDRLALDEELWFAKGLLAAMDLYRPSGRPPSCVAELDYSPLDDARRLLMDVVSACTAAQAAAMGEAA